MDSSVAVPTYRLETFGKLALTGAASAGVSHQRRRLALLALLAAAGKSGLSRDQLIGYLWPESSSANGRHSLEQLLHGMRRGLGESIFTGTNPVALNPEVITSDVGEFESAIDRQALADAVALVSGPFLQGFYLEDAPEFERWSSSERSRLSHKYEEILGRLADHAESAGDFASLLRWRRRLVEVDPVGSRPALALMRALSASGDRTAALQHARVYESTVRQELDSGPDPSIVAYAAELRAGKDDAQETRNTVGAALVLPRRSESRADADAPADESPQSEDENAEGRVFEVASSLPPPLSSASAAPAAKNPQARSARARWFIGLVLMAVAVSALLFVRNRDAKPTLDDNRIVVVPFRVSGADSSVKYLGEGIVDLIAPMLTGEGGPSAVDARTAISTWKRVTLGREGTINDARQVARELGAALVLSGSIVEVAGKLTITGNILSGKSGEIRQLTSVTASADSIDTLLDRFVGQLLARQSGVAETSLTAVTSQSLPAIRAYLSGRAAYRKADEEGAIAAYARALDLDSTFALAALDLVVATEQLMRTQICREGSCRVYSQVPGFTSSIRSDDLFNRAVTLAWNYRSKLGKRDLPLLAAFRGRNFPGESSARETLEGLNRAVAAAPDRPESHYLLGVLLLYQGPALGLSDARTRAAAAFREAIRLDSTYLGPRARLVDIDAFEFNAENLRRDGLNYLAYDNAGPTAEYVRWLVSSAGADGAVQNIAPAPLRSLSAQTLEQIFTTSQMAGLRLEDADSVVKIMAENATDPIEKSVWFGRAYQLALNRGRPSEATESIRRMNDLRKPSYVFPRFAISAAVFDDGDRAAADSSSRTLAAKLERDTLETLAPDQIRPINGAMAMQALWYLEKGDTVAASRASDWLRRHSAGGPSAGVLAFLPEMQLTSRARHPDGAPLRARVDSILRDGCCQLPDIVGIALERAYAQSGDPAAALRVVRRGIWYQPPRGLATYLRDEGRLSTKLGDREGAIKAYKHFLALRSNPERSLRAATDSVRAELKRLEGAR